MSVLCSQFIFPALKWLKKVTKKVLYQKCIQNCSFSFQLPAAVIVMVFD